MISLLAGQAHFDGLEDIFNGQMYHIYQKFSYMPWDNETEYRALRVSCKKLVEGFDSYNKKAKIKSNVENNLINVLEELKKTGS